MSARALLTISRADQVQRRSCSVLSIRRASVVPTSTWALTEQPPMTISSRCRANIVAVVSASLRVRLMPSSVSRMATRFDGVQIPRAAVRGQSNERDPGLLIACFQRALDRCCAPPSWQQRCVRHDEASCRDHQQLFRNCRAERDQDTRVEPQLVELAGEPCDLRFRREIRRLDWQPEQCRFALDGAGREWVPRPAGASGLQTTSATSWWA